MSVPDVAGRLRAVQTSLPEGVALVAVSKFHPVAELRAAYGAGQRAFGESRAQELVAKAPEMPADVEWHFIGHLQSNKVRPVVTHAAVIQSVDSARLLRLIDAEAQRQGRKPEVLLEVHVAQELTKSGFTPAELLAPDTLEAIAGLKAARVTGVMGMASLTDDQSRIAADFRAIAQAAEALRRATGLALPRLSMGMSDDYQLAVEAGSNMVRVGSAIFGPRQY